MHSSQFTFYFDYQKPLLQSITLCINYAYKATSVIFYKTKGYACVIRHKQKTFSQMTELVQKVSDNVIEMLKSVCCHKNPSEKMVFLFAKQYMIYYFDEILYLLVKRSSDMLHLNSENSLSSLRLAKFIFR
uniref:Uncharacterized protein n=1 Tax=Onchocerca volvulus TaxID=6282 RepID=A0A8R1TNG0_ONCVO